MLRHMVRREIQIDEDTDQVLTELAAQYHGDLGMAVTDLVQTRQRLEDFAERSEAAREAVLRDQREKAESAFREGRTLTWQEVKARNGL